MIVYISGPYTANTEDKIMENILVAERFAINLWNKGHYAICPHLNTRLFEKKCCHTTIEDYMVLDFALIQRSDCLLMLLNWKDSKGAVREKEYAESLGIPIYLNIDDIPLDRQPGLVELLRWFDEFVAIERQRIIKCHSRYGDDWKTKDNLQERYFEMLDLFGYKALQYAQEKYKKKT
jgi:nucleoside 2-deoxyribosyltransferase